MSDGQCGEEPEQQEQVEWDTVNRLLQLHGFKPIQFADPKENKTLTDLVLLEKKSALDVRHTLKMMIKDSERRQALIQELIQSNSLLKEEVHQQQSRAARMCERVAELETALRNIPGKQQSLQEPDRGKDVQQHRLIQQLRQEHRDTLKRCQSLEHQLVEEKEVSSQLQRKHYFTLKEAERRVARQNHVFRQIRKRAPRSHWQTDQQLLDVIDVYEAQIQQLREEVLTLKGQSGGRKQPNLERSKTTEKGSSAETTSEGTGLLKLYQDQLRETKTQQKELKADIQCLRKDLQTRLDHGVERDHTDHLHDNLCKKYLKTLSSIRAAMRHPRAPVTLHRCDGNVKEAEFSDLVPTVQRWAEQLASLRELHSALRRLALKLLPWQPGGSSDSSEELRVEDLMLMVETMLAETSKSDQSVQSPSRNSLLSMVSHFQQLFDVTSFNGVYPRMNEIYSKLGEMSNTLKNLRDVFGLDEGASSSEVVKVATRISSAHQNVHSLLGTRDIDSIIVKLKEHEEFFPAFHSLVVQLLQTLDIGTLDLIVPAVTSLKSRAV